jgi:hypothetical protein
MGQLPAYQVPAIRSIPSTPVDLLLVRLYKHAALMPGFEYI